MPTTFRYANLDPRHAPHGFRDVFRWSVLDRLTGRRRVAPPGPPAPRVADGEAIHRPEGPPRVTWIGHSSFLATLSGASFLLDPVFSRRIAYLIPRHGEPGLLASELPPLAALLVTHNHYDHLDAPSVRALPRRLPVFTAAGLGRWFRRRGFTEVTELRWWESAPAGPLTITFVPARHWSRRIFLDTNRSAWGGFVVEAGGLTIYHAGDTGWFDGFGEIAARFPAIDLALLPIGAYAPAWFMEPHHMNPEQAIDALLTLRARAMVPMHWGAFQLTDEPLREPAERLVRAWDIHRPAARLHLLAVGETVSVA
jgi:L-ascorbate metabolism protein UlaG (beta-lactamase superfamily)